MNKKAPYEHEHVEGFDKMENLEVCANMEAILQIDQTQKSGENLATKLATTKGGNPAKKSNTTRSLKTNSQSP